MEIYIRNRPDSPTYDVSIAAANGLTIKQTRVGDIEIFVDGEQIYPVPERHAHGCICADCSGAELTAEND